MAITLITDPSRLSDGVTSGLSAVNSQTPFEFQRGFEDCILIEDTVVFPGSVQINLDGSLGDLTAQFTDGVNIRVAQSFNSVALGLYIVRQSAFAIGQTQIICYETFVETAVDVIIYFADRENYHIIIEIMEPDNSALLIDQQFIYIPRQDGFLFFDLGPILQGIMDAFDTKLFSYSIRYSEFFDNVQGPTSTLANPLDAVRGRRQIGKLLGANLWNWILKPLTAGVYGRIFTDFHEPKIWFGFEKTLDILFDSRLSDRVNSANTITIKIDGMDINKVVDGATNSESILPAVWFDNPQMYSIDLKAIVDLPGFADSKYVRISVLDTAIDLIDPLICKIVQCLTNGTVMLQWLNDVGGTEQWVFDYNQKVDEDVMVGEVIEFPIIEDFSTVRRTKGRLVHEEIQRITMTAENLMENEVRALKYIKSSPSLQIELDGNFFNVVVISSFATPWETQHSTHSFTVTIELPVEFDYYEQVPL